MLSITDVTVATGGKIISESGQEFSGVSIDSRTIKEGDLFIALKGDRFDGHDFVDDALKKGSGAIVQKPEFQELTEFKNQKLKFNNKTVIFVNDTLLALHSLAKYIRKGFKGRVIGVVGSNGKTTTKELISAILGLKFNVIKTEGNLNNHIGMPLCIINGSKKWASGNNGDIMVLEMGTNRPGDINELCSIALPDIGVVTNIGYEHLQGFGSLHKVRESELEILPYVNKVAANADDSFLMEGIFSEFDGEIVTFGIENRKAVLTAVDIVFLDNGTKFYIQTGDTKALINSRLSGRFNIYNSLAAASAACILGFGMKDIKIGLESFSGMDMRFEVREALGVTFLYDVYNANPSSMEASLKELSRFAKLKNKKDKRAIAVLGEMLELGDFETEAHRNLGQQMSESQVDIFIGVGSLMPLAIEQFNGKGICFDTAEEAGIELGRILREGDVVLIKGSRGKKMERVLDSLKKIKGDIHAL
jgi:UDP-N-acetylmuramoyl-tripeptide--D-alanyl-D-alanine ligase